MVDYRKEYLRVQKECIKLKAELEKDQSEVERLKEFIADNEIILTSAHSDVKRFSEYADNLQVENEEYARRLLSHMKGEGVKATCDIHGDWWYVDDEPIVCPSCRPEQALKGGGQAVKGLKTKSV